MKRLVLFASFSLYVSHLAASDTITTQPKGTITPTVAPRVREGFDLAIDADFIWWKSQVSGMNFAEIDHKIKSPSSSFEPGFKVGIGMDLDFDGWDAYAEYTWVKEPWHTDCYTSKKDVSYSGFVTANPTDGILSSMIIADACYKRKSQFNILDLELGRNFFISKRLTLRPNLGFKLARLFDKTHFTQNEEGLFGFGHIFLSQSLSGIGTRLGLDSVWHLTKSFGIYGDIAATALWSSIHSTCSSHYKIDLISIYNSSKQNTQTILPVLEVGIGLAYMKWLYNEAYQLYAKAGWEEQIWSGYNHSIQTSSFNSTGALTMQGLTAKLGFVF
jgi:hypothetical protein